MSPASSSEKAKGAATWYIFAFDQLVYLVWVLTLCRIGHKPVMELHFNRDTGKAIVFLNCSRCCRTLEVRYLPILDNESIAAR